MASSKQPTWSHPQTPTHEPELKIYNTLTHSKVPFVPREEQKISWYSCGPTVYDDAHLGHARNYVTTDIIRRILRDYFHFNMHFVMNITDVDDKIILAGRKRFFYKQYQEQHKYIDDQVRQDVTHALFEYVARRLTRFDPKQKWDARLLSLQIDELYKDVLSGQAMDPGGKPGDKEAKIKMYITEAKSTLRAVNDDPKTLTPTAFYTLVKDVMCESLDSKFSRTVQGTDHHIFKVLTEEYEDRFFQDMHDLNVLPPDTLTRVTEYGDQIARFVDRIVEKGFAYATQDNSVYFDIRAFEAAGNPYARLAPSKRGDVEAQADGEGALSQRSSGKRNDADFALWKASKPGEPSWNSSFGPGRPGWHIECSVMASEVLGPQMDIHSGGIDLEFPHHDNELAQSEAYWHCGKPSQWVNYFIHMGHLHISGAKMSKSLKNFTTIRQALDQKQWTSRSLRVVFLLGNWRDGIEITDSLVEFGRSWEDMVDNFFFKVIERSQTATQTSSKPALEDALRATNQRVRQALLDSFNTPEAMAAISTLITEYNSQKPSSLSREDHINIGIFVTRMVNIFGLNGNASPTTEQIGWSDLEIPEAAKPYVQPLAQMRDQLRSAAIAKSITPETIRQIIDSVPKPTTAEVNGSSASTTNGTNAAARPRPSYSRTYNEFVEDVLASPSRSNLDSNTMNKDILSLCDKVRDIDLWNLDIYLEDREAQPSLIRPVTEGLRAIRREREDKLRKTEEAKKADAQSKKAKLLEGKLTPGQMFRSSEEFGTFDENSGLPLTLRNGEPIPASRMKRIKKEWEAQAKKNAKYVEAVRKGVILE